MRLGAAIVGDIRKVLADEVRAGERAAMTAIRAETEQVKAELRRQVATAFSGNARGIANAWRSMIFPRSGQSLRLVTTANQGLPNVALAELAVFRAIRTLTSTLPSTVYTAAQQVSDFGTTQPAITIAVSQISAAVGRGISARASL